MSITQSQDDLAAELTPPNDSDAGIGRRKDLRKTTINLPSALLKKLEQTQDEIGAASVSEVFRNALKLYLHLHEETKAGAKVMTVDPEGNRTSYQLHLG